MNIVLLSPNFPPNYYHFAIALRNIGATVLAIGDAPYDDLHPALRDALTEYFCVDSLHYYDQVLRAGAYFTYRYGKLHRLESHNEAWLETDARLRTDFNIPGLKIDAMEGIKRKSLMKQVFIEAGVDVAAGGICRTLAEARDFVAEVGYPIIAKPDVGVGAADTFKITSDQELARFFTEKPLVDYVLEEFIEGDLHSFDGLTDQDGRMVFSTAHFYQPSIMDVVNHDLDVFACSLRQIPPGLRRAGTLAVRAFDVRERFFHIEFFRVSPEQAGEAEPRWIAVEMNMRPPGGLMLDVINYANDIDLYQQWANVVVFNSYDAEAWRPYHCAFVGRKRRFEYQHTLSEIRAACGPLLVHHMPIAPVFARAMGDYAYILRAPELADLQAAIDFIMAQ